ncbi:Neuroligin-4, Y-linked [Harpegnathos saltator]|uniref:Neuroligin-4, Y-linked n=1 Tax=Harpegnathos saltator TaxID=610380 RepID=E2BJF7_HARSA|nr:Neuroligin-4, Y-linked [Harpegnathos saltator]
MTSSSPSSSSSILVLFGLILAISSAQLSSRIVRTKYGELSGVIVTLDRYLEGVEVFRGVPYASPPIGSLRFMPPVTGALWHSVKVADKFGPVCPQKLPELSDKMPKGRVEYLKRLLPYLRNQSEDCLYLNIYAPVQEGGLHIAEVPAKFFCRVSQWRLEYACGGATAKLNKKLYNHLVLREIKAHEE